MAIETLENFIRAWLKLARNQMRLFIAEAKLAQQSILPFFGFLLLLIIAGSILGVFTLLTLIYCLYRLSGSMLTGVLTIEAICIITVIVIFRLFYTNFKQLKFSRTRRYMQHQAQKEANNGQD